ncbi:MAG TPA: MarR family transcriptional regulator [Membranihabitans sp.]|nr:MarR family transcriptional regulator [Membranihabitans sp.]
MKNGKQNPIEISFLNSEHETHEKVLRTAAHLKLKLSEQLKQFELDLSLYDILRVIHSRSEKAINIKEIQSSLLHKMTNTSRLIRVLEDRNLIVRKPSEKDKRVVNVLLTEKGSFVMEELDDLTAQFYVNEFSRLNHDELDTLNVLLDRLLED